MMAIKLSYLIWRSYQRNHMKIHIWEPGRGGGGWRFLGYPGWETCPIGLKIEIYGVSRCSEIPQKFQILSSTKNIFFSSSKIFWHTFSKMFFGNFDFFWKSNIFRKKIINIFLTHNFRVQNFWLFFRKICDFQKSQKNRFVLGKVWHIKQFTDPRLVPKVKPYMSGHEILTTCQWVPTHLLDEMRLQRDKRICVEIQNRETLAALNSGISTQHGLGQKESAGVTLLGKGKYYCRLISVD